MTINSGSTARRESGDRRAPQYVGYFRVSSPIQGNSGLSLDAQAAAVRRFVEGRGGKLVAEFSEIRTGLKSAGMQLREALRICRMRRATLVVASIDRLSRRLALITAVMDSDIELAVVDSPNASRVVLQINGAWAEHESERCRNASRQRSQRRRSEASSLEDDDQSRIFAPWLVSPIACGAQGRGRERWRSRR